MILVFIIVFCAMVALGFGAAAAWSDYSRLSIPNLYSICIGASFIPAFLAIMIFASDASLFASWKSHLLALAIVFGVTYLLFYLKLIGGGDSKLLSVYALWVGLAGLTPLLFFMALTGGLLGVTTLALRKWKPVKQPAKDSWIEKAQAGKQDVPYGIAIFVGALISFWQVGYLKFSELIALAGA